MQKILTSWACKLTFYRAFIRLRSFASHIARLSTCLANSFSIFSPSMDIWIESFDDPHIFCFDVCRLRFTQISAVHYWRKCTGVGWGLNFHLNGSIVCSMHAIANVGFVQYTRDYCFVHGILAVISFSHKWNETTLVRRKSKLLLILGQLVLLFLNLCKHMQVPPFFRCGVDNLNMSPHVWQIFKFNT